MPRSERASGQQRPRHPAEAASGRLAGAAERRAASSPARKRTRPAEPAMLSGGSRKAVPGRRAPVRRPRRGQRRDGPGRGTDQRGELT